MLAMESEKGWMLVERMYRGLARLTEAALVMQFVSLAMIFLRMGVQIPFGAGAEGPGFLGGVLLYDAVLSFRAAASVLIDGAVILGIVLAWADGRRRWMLALVVAEALFVIVPAVLFTGPDFLAAHPRIRLLIEQNVILLINAASVPPASLALVFARFRGGGRATLRAEADATLEITRSPL